MRASRAWIARYLPLELSGTVGAVGAAVLAEHVTGHAAVAATAGAVGEALGFYTAALLRSFRQHRAVGGQTGQRSGALALRSVLVEFGPAELLDTFLLRAPLMWLMPMLLGDFVLGIVAGKVIADVAFYLVAASSRSRWSGVIDPPAPGPPGQAPDAGSPVPRPSWARRHQPGR